MHGDSRARWPVVIEELTIGLVVTREIVHIHKIRRYFDDVAQFGAGTLQNIANVFNDSPGLLVNIEVRGPELIRLSACNRVVGAAGTRSRDDKKVSSTLHMWILSARLSLSLDDF